MCVCSPCQILGPHSTTSEFKDHILPLDESAPWSVIRKVTFALVSLTLDSTLSVYIQVVSNQHSESNGPSGSLVFLPDILKGNSNISNHCSAVGGWGNSTVVSISVYQAGEPGSRPARSACYRKVEFYHCAIYLLPPVPTTG